MADLQDQAPDSTVPADRGREVSLAALAGPKGVPSFYTTDDTPACA